MFGLPARCIRYLAFALIAMVCANAGAQPSSSTAKIISWNPGTAGDIYVGVMGEITRPGVYRLDPQSVNLQSVIRRAGGLKAEASGTIRLVRQDRIVGSVFFTPQSNNALLPGDLLVVESKRTQAAVSREYDANPLEKVAFARESENALKSVAPSVVHVAFVNVLDRPVIVPIKQEDSRLDRLVQKLNQPIELAQAVRVIGSDRALTQSAAPQSINASISDGSVLIFPRNAVIRGMLPPLPVPYDSEIASGAFPSLIGGTSGQSAELRNVGQLPPRIARDSQYSPQEFAQPADRYQSAPHQPNSTAIHSMSPAESSHLEIPPATIQTPIVSSPPRIARTIPFSGQPRITSSSQLSKIDDSPAPPRRPNANVIGEDIDKIANPASQAARLRSNRSSLESRDHTIEDNDLNSVSSANDASISLTSLFGIAACVGLLIGLAIFTRRKLDQTITGTSSTTSEISASEQLSVTGDEIIPPQIESTSTPVDIALVDPISDELPIESITPIAAIEMPSTSIGSEAKWFDQLLADQLPIHDETPDFPQQIALQGQIVAQPILRLDPAVTRPIAQGPHFSLAGQAEQGSGSSIGQVPAILDSALGDVDGRHIDSPGKPHFMRRRAGRNTVAAAAANDSSIAATEIGNSPTPVADALRQLQGGQP